LERHRSADNCYDLLVFPGGERALQISQSEEARTVSLETGEVLAKFERSAYFSHANAISPDGTVVALMRDRGLIGIYDSESGARLRTLKVRQNYICSLQFLPDGRRLFYATESAGAAIVDVNSSEELAGTWFGYSYLTGGALSSDGTYALVGSGTGEVERWSIGPVLARNRALALLDVQTIVAMAQVLSGMILTDLEAIALPRQTGRFNWNTADGKPPEFLSGGLPEWVPRLQGIEVSRAREFLRSGGKQRGARLDAAAATWIDRFEGFRYREVLESDLSTRRIEIPPREKDENGNYIGEPQGRVDFVRWINSARQIIGADVRQRVLSLTRRGDAAMQRRDWRSAQSCFNSLLQIEPSNIDALIKLSQVSAELREPWGATWQLSEQFDNADKKQQAELQMLWARLVGMEGDYDGMLQRFEAAREAGYSSDDWHLRRLQAMEETGRYLEAVAQADLAAAQVTDPELRLQIANLRNRCIAWNQLRVVNGGRPRIVVTAVPEGSVAETSGLKPGDIILSLQIGEEERLNYYPEPVDTTSMLWSWREFLNTGDSTIEHATLTVRRAGTDVELQLARAPLDAELFTIRMAE
jgi:hypothetical protein